MKKAKSGADKLRELNEALVPEEPTNSLPSGGAEDNASSTAVENSTLQNQIPLPAVRPVPCGQESLLIGRWTDHLPTCEDHDDVRSSVDIG